MMLLARVCVSPLLMGLQPHLSDLCPVFSWFIPFLSSLIMIYKPVSLDLDLEGLHLRGPF